MLRAVAGAASVVLLVLAPNASPAPALFKDNVTLTMDDGAKIAATVYRPFGEPPAGGWPAIVFLHGLAGNRQQLDPLIQTAFATGYVLLAFDARGHGESTGLVSADGPREIADVRAIESWLARLPEVSNDQIGAWGISYGGGAVLNSLVAGVPWKAVAVVETWTDLYAALAPQDLVKSGFVAALAASIPDARKSPELREIQALAFTPGQHRGALMKWTRLRSSLSRLGSVRTPVFIAQGRRDFLFGIDQGVAAFRALRGPKALWLGLHGHPPSTFPAADTGRLLLDTHAWFDCYLTHKGCSATPRRVTIVPQNFNGDTLRGTGIQTSAALPKTGVSRFELRGSKTIAREGKVVRTTAKLPSAIETLGSPRVRLSVTPRKGWSRLVAVLSALTPSGEVVVGAGGVPLSGSKMRTVTIRMSDQMTFVPKGSRLRLTLGSSSLAQSPSNLVYLDLPMPDGANVRLGNATLSLPRLRTPVTK